MAASDPRHTFELRLTPLEVEALELVAGALDTSPTDVLRRLCVEGWCESLIDPTVMRELEGRLGIALGGWAVRYRRRMAAVKAAECPDDRRR